MEMDRQNGGTPPLVMVVEDFEDNRFMMRRLLEMSGYRVLEAINGEELWSGRTARDLN